MVILLLLGGTHAGTLRAKTVTGLRGFSGPVPVLKTRLSTGRATRLPKKAVAVERDYPAGPVAPVHPAAIRVDGRWNATDVLILFAEPGAERRGMANPGVPDRHVVERVVGRRVDGMRVELTRPRQHESHGGFKTFAFMYSPTRAVVLKAHMLFSRPMRFMMRFNTLMLTVVDRADDLQWAVSADIQLKADYGPALVSLQNGTHLPLNAMQEKIQKEVQVKHFNPRRRFMATAALSAASGLQTREYEFWDTGLATCWEGTLRFDLRDPTTGVGSMEGTMGRLRGASINRVFSVHSERLVIDPALCRFSGGVDVRDGVFYTDPYFERGASAAGAFSMRQFIRPTFRLVMDRVMLFPQDVLTGRLDARDVGVLPENIESAVDPMLN